MAEPVFRNAPDRVTTSSRVPRRTRLYVLCLRALTALITLAVLAGFVFGDRVVGWLPDSTAFVVVFVCAVVALLVWADRVMKRWRAEEERSARRSAHFASSPRTKRVTGETVGLTAEISE